MTPRAVAQHLLGSRLDKTNPIAAYTRLRTTTAINCNGWIAADGYETRNPDGAKSVWNAG